MEGSPSWRNDQRGVVGNGYYSPDVSATSIPASPLLSTLPSLLSGSPHQASMYEEQRREGCWTPPCTPPFGCSQTRCPRGTRRALFHSACPLRFTSWSCLLLQLLSLDRVFSVLRVCFRVKHVVAAATLNHNSPQPGRTPTHSPRSIDPLTPLFLAISTPTGHPTHQHLINAHRR